MVSVFIHNDKRLYLVKNIFQVFSFRAIKIMNLSSILFTSH